MSVSFIPFLFFALFTFTEVFSSIDNLLNEGSNLLSHGELERSVQDGFSYAEKLSRIEDDLIAKGIYVDSKSPFYRMAKFKKPNPEAMDLSVRGQFLLEMTRSLQSKLSLNSNTEGVDLRAISSNFSVINNTCLATPTCYPASKYRTMDGSCNNLAAMNLGKSGTDYRRVLPPVYNDGISSPRSLATNGSALISPRLISTTVIGSGDHPSTTNTLAVMQFGQFLNHDLESTTQFTFANGTDIACCYTNGSTIAAALAHPACLAIAVPADDRFFNKPPPPPGRSALERQKGPPQQQIQTCMSFVRSIAGPRLNCSLGYADQLNSNTHWLDGSNVYGSTNATMNLLRSFTGGLLKMTNDTVNNRTLLPISQPCSNGACFIAGDSRLTEQPQLTVMHTLWAREHNRIAKTLAGLNPTWKDEVIYQEARRIVGAEMQHIAFYEWLPSLLSSIALVASGLLTSAPGYYTAPVKSATSGPISNELATATLRMGHSLVQGIVNLYDESGNLLGSSYNMSSFFNDGSPLVKDKTFIDNVIRGLLVQPSQSIDKEVDDEIWNKLFRGSAQNGFDIVALNIQRGRDHGLPSYNKFRQLCNLTKLTSFADLKSLTPQDVPGKLAQVYASVDDIDLYIGGLFEIPSKGASVGPIVSCLMAEQFSQLKNSDRFYYERGNLRSSFSAPQLTEIRKASLARLMCDNNDGSLKSIQPKAFQVVGSTNAKVACSTLPAINLNLWKGEAV